MNTDRIREELITHLKKAGLDDERIEKILSIISIEEAYENLQKNKELKKTVNCTGLEGWPKEMKKNVKGLVSIDDVRLISRNEDRSDHTMETIDRVLNVIEEESNDLRKKIKNSIRAYVMGDALGVPFEFREKGTFECRRFEGYMSHHQEPGTWSDDTSILLCLMEALAYSNEPLIVIQRYKQNLSHWYYNDEFAVDKLFDIGNQTSNAINSQFETKKKTSRMGNGALFYSLPLACIFLNKEIDTVKIFERFCSITHNNDNCFSFGLDFSLLLRDLFQSLPSERASIESYSNRGDVINTFQLVCDEFQKRKESSSTLFEDLCGVIDLGQDTDTNAALFGALMGTIKEIDEEDWKQVQRHEYIDRQIDSFLNSLEVNGALKC